MLEAAALAAVILGLMQLWVGDVLTWIGSTSTNLIGASLRIERAILPEDGGAILSATLINNLFHMMYDVACGLMLLKFLWKGFQIYVLWRDGDSDVSPHNMAVGVLLAIVICAGFPTVYNMATSITVYVGKEIIQAIDPTGVLPGMSEDDLQAKAEQRYQELLNTLDLNRDGTITYREWFPVMDTNGDGELSEDELLPYFDEDGDGQLDENEWAKYQSTFLYNTEGITRQVYVQWFIDENTQDFDERISNMNWFELLFVYIYAVAFILMWLRLLGRGFEMMILRVGLPIAAVGLIDSDSGVFKNYTQLLLRQMITSVFQVAALRLSIMFVFNMTPLSVMVSISILIAAFGAPKLLQQIMTPQGGGSGIGSKVYQGVMIWRMLKR